MKIRPRIIRLRCRISREELTELMRGYGYDPHFVEGDDPAVVHQCLAATLDAILAQIRQIQSTARSRGETESLERPRWPMIIFLTPKGWTGPKFVDGKPVEGTWRLTDQLAFTVPCRSNKGRARVIR